jgi:hypothetical protein
VYSIKIFQGQIDSNVVEDSSLLGCDVGWVVCVYMTHTSPEYFHQAPGSLAPQSGLHSPSVHMTDNSTAVLHHHKVKLYASIHCTPASRTSI